MWSKRNTPSLFVGGNADWCNYSGKQYDAERPVWLPEHCVHPVDVPVDTKDHADDLDSANIGTGAMGVGYLQAYREFQGFEEDNNAPKLLFWEFNGTSKSHDGVRSDANDQGGNLVQPESENNPDVSQLKNGLRKCGTYTQWSIAPQRKNNTSLKFADKWKELENIILSEVTQTQKDKHEFSWNADTIYTSCLPSGHSAFYSTVNQSNTFTSYRAISTADNEDLEDGKRDDKDNGEDGNDGDNEVSDDGVNGDVDNGDTDGGNDGDDGDRDDGSDGDDKDNADNGDNGYSGDRDNEDDGDHTDDEVDGDDRDVETIETEMIEETMETEKTETIEMTEMETKRW
ncbi:hypothetical protein STEG23_014520 [Scotinomys teguina]